MATPSVQLQIIGGPKAALPPLLRQVLHFLRIAQGAWTINVVRDSEMRALHQRTLGIPTTTDVLTFDLRDAAGKKQGARSKKPQVREGLPVDLDTVICVDEARRRAKEMGHTVREELLLYCVHSLLHVQGYDDVTDAGARQMHAREDEILQAIGVGRVYDRKTTSHSQIADLKSQISNSKSPILEAGTLPQNQKSKIKNRKSARRRP